MDPMQGRPNGQATRVRFGVHEMDLVAEELFRSGQRIALAPQPARLLAHLLRHPGELVRHEELRQLLWPDGMVRDFEQGVHTAVRQVRHAIRDVATGSRYIETLPRKGYRFVAPVEVLDTGPKLVHAEAPPAVAPDPPAKPETASRWRWPLLISAALAVCLGLFLASRPGSSPNPALTETSIPPWTRGEDPRTFVAVLPLRDLSEGRPHPALAAGMTEELISSLGRVHPDRLGVIARSSVMQYDAGETELSDIADQLQVDYAIEGSVRTRGDRVRIELRLIDCATSLLLWSEGHWRPYRDLYALHSELAARIAGKLAIDALPADPKVIAAQGSPSDLAYAAYLDGRQSWHQFTGPALRESVNHYRKAVKIDPVFSQAWGAMAESWALLAMSGEDPSKAYSEAAHCVDRALAISEATPSAWECARLCETLPRLGLA